MQGTELKVGENIFNQEPFITFTSSVLQLPYSSGVNLPPVYQGKVIREAASMKLSQTPFTPSDAVHLILNGIVSESVPMHYAYSSEVWILGRAINWSSSQWRDLAPKTLQPQGKNRINIHDNHPIRTLISAIGLTVISNARVIPSWYEYLRRSKGFVTDLGDVYKQGRPLYINWVEDFFTDFEKNRKKIDEQGQGDRYEGLEQILGFMGNYEATYRKFQKLRWG